MRSPRCESACSTIHPKRIGGLPANGRRPPPTAPTCRVPEGIATVVAYRVVQALLAIHHITSNALGTADSVDAEREAPPGATQSGLNPSTKAAMQVAVATSAAAILGELVSPDRWYWAVVTAFLVFTGVSTRGEILTRAGHRIVGTIAGVVAGVLLATLVGNHQRLQIVLLVICVFCAFYLVAVAYAWLTFFVTVLLAMLYGLLGNFSVEVLELRIAETAVGGVVGIASAYFIFSTGTRATLVEKVDDYLDRMTELIDAGIDSVVTPGGETDLVAETRRLDNALQSVITAGKPLRMGPAARSRRGVRRVLRGLQVSNRSAHALARAGVNAARADPDTAPPEAVAAALRDAATRVCGTIDTVKHVVAGNTSRSAGNVHGDNGLDGLRGLRCHGHVHHPAGTRARRHSRAEQSRPCPRRGDSRPGSRDTRLTRYSQYSFIGWAYRSLLVSESRPSEASMVRSRL